MTTLLPCIKINKTDTGARPHTPAEIAKVPVHVGFRMNKGDYARIMETASKRKMKAAEMIRHLITTHPIMADAD